MKLPICYWREVAALGVGLRRRRRVTISEASGRVAGGGRWVDARTRPKQQKFEHLETHDFFVMVVFTQLEAARLEPCGGGIRWLLRKATVSVCVGSEESGGIAHLNGVRVCRRRRCRSGEWRRSCRGERRYCCSGDRRRF
ncbi:Mannan endo-1,6-alpha-mannosidase DFG5 [Striga asiatica]|uniref:Mannan endo-1,6-alpha-mannosidase DFG5 n=1 Tax=Striga asiatica TaxID=4170 RepID=A0A5A7RBL4_STRAF|nr:Mannan endo-1,6-alpha-mannosidase DFG5 [Striga asiatica]